MKVLKNIYIYIYMVVSLNYCSQNGRDLYRVPYYNGNRNIGPRKREFRPIPPIYIYIHLYVDTYIHIYI